MTFNLDTEHQKVAAAIKDGQWHIDDEDMVYHLDTVRTSLRKRGYHVQVIYGGREQNAAGIIEWRIKKL